MPPEASTWTPVSAPSATTATTVTTQPSPAVRRPWWPGVWPSSTVPAACPAGARPKFSSRRRRATCRAATAILRRRQGPPTSHRRVAPHRCSLRHSRALQRPLPTPWPPSVVRVASRCRPLPPPHSPASPLRAAWRSARARSCVGRSQTPQRPSNAAAAPVGSFAKRPKSRTARSAAATTAQAPTVAATTACLQRTAGGAAKRFTTNSVRRSAT
mmetsp:Transcript_43253/g.133624  ORF Transcript_43253/g.133624 Transcript_43253/m.133624 type:complete len:214 (-) Transcript_43253:217-858(-)